MVEGKYTTKIIALITALAVCLCLCAVWFADRLKTPAEDKGIAMEYETALFDTSEILNIEIVMDQADWQEMIEHATAEEYYRCDVVINGETFYGVGIRPKGNTSLTTIAADPDTDRYSFKLEFDHYVDGQTCYGLDKLVLNNNFADATNMKEALIYDMYQYFGADASLYNYASISINGEYWGLYLALEAVEDSFMLRNYGTQDGELYKPDSMNMNNTGMGDLNPPDRGDNPASSPSGREQPDDVPAPGGGSEMEGGMQPPDMGGGGFGGGPTMSGNGADLNYTDDDLESYSTIWDGAVTDTNDADHKRVVTALKNIAEGTDLASYMDIENLLRYMAVHIFSVNEDSLSGTMAHNYYLYEYDGQLNIIPWDYNLALGGMNGGSATSVVNEAIDNAFSGTEFFDTLMENQTYHEQYYAYLQQLVEDYINGGGFDSFYNRVRSQIDQLVETDPTAFYTYEEYQQAAETLYEVVKLRGESISGQLDGTIPSTAAEQSGSDTLIDASHIDLDVMGSMKIGGGFDSGGQEDGAAPMEQTAPVESGDASAPGSAGNPSDGSDTAQFGGDFDPPQPEAGGPENRESPSGDTAPSVGGASDTQTGGINASMMTTLRQYGLSVAVLVAALLFAVLYRRKPRRR